MCLLGSFDSPDCRGLVSILRLAVIYFTLSINHDMTSQPTNFETLPARANPPPRARRSKPLGIAFSNIRGFRSNFTSVQSFVHNNSPDLLALSESRLSSDISSDSFKLPGYIFHRLDHPPSHGLGVYIKDTLPVARESTLECNNQEYMCFRLSLLHSTTYLYFLYRSPSSSSCAVIDAISDSIDRAISQHPAAQVMVFGDFNVHHKEWLIHSRNTDVAGTATYNFSISQGLTQIVSSPTHIPDRASDGRYLLDLFLCSNPDDCVAKVLSPIGNSDHSIVSVSVSYSSSPTTFQPFHRTVFQYGRADWDGFRSFLADVPWSFVLSLGPDLAAEELSEWISLGIEIYIPSRTYQIRAHSQPWYTPECAAAIAHRNHYFKTYHRLGTLDSKCLFHDARNRCKRVLEEAKQHYANSVAGSIATQRLGSRDFWRIANSVLNRNKPSIPPLFHGPEVLTSPLDKANLFADNFVRNSTVSDEGHPLPAFPPRTDNEVSDPLITPKKVARIIHTLDASKATGPDRIPVIVLKMCSPELSSVLAKLFNMCLSDSVFPSSWKVASVVPIFKGAGERSEPTNYRPISLLPIISKIFECFVNQQLMGYLEDNDLLTDCQYGFRHSRSTGDLLSLITDHLNRALDHRGEARVVALDISKAFDKVWHHGLLHKLKSYGVTGRMLSIISAFLSNRKLKVVLDGQSSPTCTVNSGVPQGSVLGPTLFLVYINDLPDNVLSQLAMYADDSTLYCVSPNSLYTSRSEVAASLDRDLEKVLRWGNDWLITFNDKKTKLLSLSRSRDDAFPSIHMGPSTLPEVSDLRLLGLDISTNASWEKYISGIAKSASMRVGCLYRAQKFLHPEAILYLYKATIRPLMEYCSHIWAGASACHLSLLDRVQKRIVNLVGEELGSSLQTLSHRRSVATLSLLYRYFHGNCSTSLFNLVPPVRVFERATRLSASSHPYTLAVTRCRTKSYSNSFFPRSASLWNSLPSGCFPPSYDLASFKRNINSYLQLSCFSPFSL